jgi:hypothetical protein
VSSTERATLVPAVALGGDRHQGAGDVTGRGPAVWGVDITRVQDGLPGEHLRQCHERERGDRPRSLSGSRDSFQVRVRWNDTR